ncbi:GGDEF domain-containing protein [Sulfuriflexus sp.]|uniref:GGDEF domain-containing protein n=1 Tax=Sulfuriflexus sp. TaxID=2015443 RepID=UPI0028CDD789|nr:GGDEF domain-containing protein [Sulfuriflexus sp.]MDT8403867.1 GGDEF domain-containing protein [Sulfuriflexus sp.]
MDAEQQDADWINLVFLDILETESLNPLYQPIVDLNRHTIYGYESLIRGPSDSVLHSPVTLFDMAIREGKLNELDILCRKIGIKGFQSKHLPGKLFLNAIPQSLLGPHHRSGLTLEILNRIGIRPENVVIELTEQYPLYDFDVMRKAIDHYRSMGFEIAIDDLGAGYSGLRTWSELRPDYVKVDRHFIQNINEDRIKQSFLRSIVDIAQGLDCRVIAEGIETQDECRTISAMGIPFGQGYYFARPAASPPYAISGDLFQCASSRDCKKQLNRTAESVADLLVETICIQPDMKLNTAHQLFHEDKSLTAIPVVDANRVPLGLLRRNQLLTMFSIQYGRSLYESTLVVDVVEKSVIIVDKEWSIEQVSKLITDSMKSQLEADFIIVEGGEYKGLGKVLDLLRKITELQIRNARYANPLTLLPGNVPIYEKLDELTTSRRNFAVAYCDIDNFKPYNDAYGYGKGDQVIKLIADILSQYAEVAVDFIGHVGGDDFIAIFLSDDWLERCNSVLRGFESEVLRFYNHADNEQGGIFSESREGDEKFYPIMSLSIGVITIDQKQPLSHAEIAELASHAKHHAKSISGNSLFIERRVRKGFPAPFRAPGQIGFS